MDPLLPLLLFGLVGAAAIELTCRISGPPHAAFLRRTLTIALGLRMLVALLFEIISGARFFHEDAAGYEWLADGLARYWSSEGPPLQILEGRPNTGYIYLLGALHYIIGRYRIIGSLLNAVIGTLTVALVYRITIELFHAVVARRAARLVAYFPSMILWSAIAIKDPLVSLLTALSLFGAIRLKRRASLKATLVTVLPIVALQPLRFYIVYFVLFAVGVSLVLERGFGSLSGIYKQIAVAGLVAALMTVAGLSSNLAGGVSELSLTKVSTFRRGMASTAQSGFAHDVDVSTPTGAALFLPVGIATLLLGPFPWQFTSMRAVLTAPEMLVWWAMVPALWHGLRFVLRERWREASPLFLFAGSLTAGYSLMEGNLGAAFRQRAQIFIFLFIFAALGHYRRRCRQAGIAPTELLVATATVAANR